MIDRLKHRVRSGVSAALHQPGWIWLCLPLLGLMLIDSAPWAFWVHAVGTLVLCACFLFGYDLAQKEIIKAAGLGAALTGFMLVILDFHTHRTAGSQGLAVLHLTALGATALLSGSCWRSLISRESTQGRWPIVEAAFEHSMTGIAIVQQHRFVRVNAEMERMFGWFSGELLGRHARVCWLTDQDCDLAGIDIERALLDGMPFDREVVMAKRDGTFFTCRLRVESIDSSDPLEGPIIWQVEDTTGSRRVEAQLRSAREEAEAANRAKSIFVANIGHEIRTPLNAILGLARLAQAEESIATRHKHLGLVADNAKYLARLLGDLLDFSRIEAGKLPIETVPFSLLDVVTSAVQTYQAFALGKGISLTFEIRSDLHDRRLGDPLRLRQILGNLLSNALKFTSEGFVHVTVKQGVSDQVLFEVQDTGIGLSTDAQERLFQPFTQADPATARRYGGTGLGLSICKELAGLMNGSIGVESSQGEGSIFWVELCLPQTNEEVLQSDFAALDPPSVPFARVLVAEDNPVNMLIFVATLQRYGMEVHQAVNGQEAIDVVTRAHDAARPIDVVLMDVDMPVMDGIAAVKRIRRKFSSSVLPIIGLTAAVFESDRLEYLDAGMNDVLSKPVEPTMLLSAIASAAPFELGR